MNLWPTGELTMFFDDGDDDVGSFGAPPGGYGLHVDHFTELISRPN